MRNKITRLAAALAIVSVCVLLSFAIKFVDAEKASRNGNLTSVFSVDCSQPGVGGHAEGGTEGVTLSVDAGEYKDSPLYYGPSEYKLLSDNRIGILDSESNRLLIYDLETNTLDKTISFPGCEYAKRFTYHDGLYYVYDVGNGAIMKVLEIDENSNVLRTIPAPDLGSPEDYEIEDEYYLADAALFSAELGVYDGKVVLMSGRSGDWVFDDYFLEGDEFVAHDPIYTHVIEKDGWSTFTYGDLSWRVYLPEFMIDILGVDEQGNLYLYCVGCLLDMDGSIYGDSCILVYNSNSELIKGGNVDLDQYPVIPSNTAKLSDNYEVYVLAGTSASIDLMKVTLTADYTIPNRSNGSTAVTASNEQAEEDYRITFSPSYTRAQAKTRAERFVNFTYTLSEKNTHAWNDCILHSSIIPQATGTTMTGAPYAWGRWDYTSTIIRSLQTVFGQYNGTDYYHCAGNVGNDDNAIYDGATGVDCSGYSSRVYGLDRHYGSSEQLSYGFKCYDENDNQDITTAIYAARSMDYWARNGHIMLHVSRSGTNVTVYEASRSAGKVRKATYPKETFENEGFKLRNPWHSEQCSDFTKSYGSTQHWDVCNICGYSQNYTNHTQSDSYSSDTATHWKQCTGCSYVYEDTRENHTWLQIAAHYRCTICLRTTTSIPVVTSLDD